MHAAEPARHRRGPLQMYHLGGHFQKQLAVTCVNARTAGSSSKGSAAVHAGGAKLYVRALPPRGEGSTWCRWFNGGTIPNASMRHQHTPRSSPSLSHKHLAAHSPHPTQSPKPGPPPSLHPLLLFPLFPLTSGPTANAFPVAPTSSPLLPRPPFPGTAAASILGCQEARKPRPRPVPCSPTRPRHALALLLKRGCQRFEVLMLLLLRLATARG